MGCFDTFIGNIECPYCKENTRFYEQTKNYECLMQNLEVGDYIDKGNANYFYKFEYPCQHCKKDITIHAAIRRGQLIGYYTDISNLDINSMENIEENYQRNLEYRMMCESGYGIIQCTYEENKSFNIGDTMHILDRDWIVDAVFEEKVKQNADNEKMLSFYKWAFKENRCYKVHDSNDNERMIIVRERDYTYITGLVGQIESHDIENYVEFCGQMGTELVKI